jgi:hypothetical protein
LNVSVDRFGFPLDPLKLAATLSLPHFAAFRVVMECSHSDNNLTSHSTNNPRVTISRLSGFFRDAAKQRIFRRGNRNLQLSALMDLML